MKHTTEIEPATDRKFYLDAGEGDSEVTFILSLHGGGSVGAWQRLYFPAFYHADKQRLVVATPSAVTKTPVRRWVGEADDAHLRGVVTRVFDAFGDRIRSFWLVGHSQGGMTSNRLLLEDPFFQQRVDGWLSLSGGRIGAIELPPSFFTRPAGSPPLPRFDQDPNAPAPGRAIAPPCDISFIFATGEHEMTSLPENSPLADKHHARSRERWPDVVDTEPGQVWDTTRDGASTPAWGLKARPGRAEIYVYPNADGGLVIADVVRCDKGHTEGLEPNITEALIEMVVAAPGGKARLLRKAR
jgi:pimeloyl-ACP methyl ester carboxylesterase